ncbi:DUF1707 domain-containing protein [Propioniciclava soli]|uniref:DUF1707 SHOCT-like domain-containing protein n=1 Tax=Propioniciclava soli TaxID=2775081 RepID=UPI001E379946|nr:DUF1707 domain-containing protein [Propioniciclava soli]
MAQQHHRRRFRAGDADRDAILQVLNEAHVAGRLGLADLRSRQESALHAVYVDELPPLVDDLPEGSAWASDHGSHALAASRVGGSVDVSPAGQSWTYTVMTGRRVDVAPGETVRNLAVLGGDSIHLGAALGPGVTLILEVPTFLGGHTLFVPAGVRVVEETQGVLGGNTVRRKAQGDGSQGTLVLRGRQIMGGHTVRLERP